MKRSAVSSTCLSPPLPWRAADDEGAFMIKGTCMLIFLGYRSFPSTFVSYLSLPTISLSLSPPSFPTLLPSLHLLSLYLPLALSSSISLWLSSSSPLPFWLSSPSIFCYLSLSLSSSGSPLPRPFSLWNSSSSSSIVLSLHLRLF